MGIVTSHSCNISGFDLDTISSFYSSHRSSNVDILSQIHLESSIKKSIYFHLQVRITR
jgi:hypothetical protein